MPYSAVVLAAGTGDRFRSDEKKQFTELFSTPILQYSLELFDRCEAVSELVIVGPEEDLDRIETLVENVSPDLSTILEIGGPSRFQSVRNGLSALRDQTDTAVFVHDAARPGTPVSLCHKLIDVHSKDPSVKGVIPVRKLPDTIKRIDPSSGAITGTLVRSELRGAQTPQLFDLDPLLEAVDAWPEEQPPTDDAQLLERAGLAVATVEGSPKARKITYPSDLTILECLLRGDETVES